MNLREMMDAYSEEGLTRALAASRVCQDIVLKAISEGPLKVKRMYIRRYGSYERNLIAAFLF